MAGKYDAIIIGGGHNGLVTACYLAKAKWKVLVLERRYVVGGACVTEEVFPGFKVSTAAYVNSLFRPEIVRDLKLREYGFESLERNPSSFSPFPDGRYLLMGPDDELNRREISKFSIKDAENYPKYEQMLLRVATVIEVTLATDAIIGAFASPSMPGTAYVLFHHVMGETNGKRGVWSYTRGGMGGLTQALAKAAKDLGVEIKTEAEVAKIEVRDETAVGVTRTSV